MSMSPRQGQVEPSKHDGVIALTCPCLRTQHSNWKSFKHFFTDRTGRARCELLGDQGQETRNKYGVRWFMMVPMSAGPCHLEYLHVTRNHVRTSDWLEPSSCATLWCYSGRKEVPPLQAAQAAAFAVLQRTLCKHRGVDVPPGVLPTSGGSEKRVHNAKKPFF